MRKLVVTEFMTVDGVMENPIWSFRYWNDETAAFKGAESETTDALLLGRVTYQAFAAAWPNSTDEGADFFNNVRKYVVSTTLDTAEWTNSVVIGDNIVAEITRLKQEDGRNITLHGSAMLAQTLMEHRLVDEYRLLVYPIVLGSGKRLFRDDITATLNLVSSQAFSTGVVALVYEPANE